MSTPIADIIIVNWNSREDTLACLDAVSRQLTKDAMITVADNGSTDGSIGAIASRYPNVRLLPLGENCGFTGGIAAALARSTARNVIFLNNDAVPEDGWLTALVDSIENAADDVISIGGKMVDPTGTLIDFVGGLLTFDGHAFQDGFRYPLTARDDPPAGSDLLFACGGNMISRREPLLALGGFDDDYFAYLEDVDFGWRTWLAGSRVTYEPRAVVRHKSSATSQRLGDFERGVLFERNALQTVLKNFESVHDASAALFTFLARLHHHATTRNANADELTRKPFSKTSKSSRSLASRIRRRIFGSKPLATIDDPLTTMQFRAFEWVIAHGDRIAAKRTAVQKLRRRSDREIFERFPLQIVPTYPGDEALMRGALFNLLRPSLPAIERTLSDIMRS
ncbi:MAG TPA: glycosyltransferase family 2 protein [Thermoanaerobaculia bacterium]|nr:glycosyltransferase family 2 protein [Thermoanaerobaculia bacterium]